MYTQKDFKTNRQFERYLDYVSLWEKLINLQKTGHKLLDEEGELVTGEFVITQEGEIGIQTGNCFTAYVGCTHEYNKLTGEYDLVYIERPAKQIKFGSFNPSQVKIVK